MFKKCNVLILPIAALSLVLFSSCGKNEAAGGAVGAGAGAVVGAEVSGKKNKGLGAFLGAITGNYFGRKIGRAADKQDAQAQETNRKFAQMEEEQHREAKRSEKWCSYCHKRVRISGANTCPYCGTGLMVEKYCRRCSRVFDARSTFKYCPQCVGGIRLASR